MNRSATVSAIVMGAALVAALFAWPRGGTQVTVIRNPYRDPYQILQGIYRADRRTMIGSGALGGVIVPHHLVASESIALGIRALVSHPPRHILLVSPDHFDQCPTLLCTGQATFETDAGPVSSHEEAVRSLGRSSLVTVSPSLFQREHGIHAVVPFIAHYLPGMSVTPVLLSQNIPWQPHREELMALFEGLLQEDTVLVVSSDFSHYLPLAEAEEKDRQTWDALEAMDGEAIAALHNPEHSDCPGCLWLMNALMTEQRMMPAVLLHTNSATILGEPNVPETTSHFSIIYVIPPTGAGSSGSRLRDGTGSPGDRTPGGGGE